METRFDLDKYIEQICIKARLDPDENNINSVPNRIFLKIVLIQNWNPILYPESEDNPINEHKFIEVLKNFKIESGLVPERKLLKYIHYLKKYFKSFPYITDVEYALKLGSDLDHYYSDPLHAFIYGEPGSGQDYIETILNGAFSGKGALTRTIECSNYNDDQLLTQLFGKVEKSSSGSKIIIKGLVDDPTKGPILIKEIQDTDEQFALETVEFLNDGIYFKQGEDQEYSSEKVIICSISAPFGALQHSGLLNLRPDDGCLVDHYKYFLYPFPNISYII